MGLHRPSARPGQARSDQADDTRPDPPTHLAMYICSTQANDLGTPSVVAAAAARSDTVKPAGCNNRTKQLGVICILLELATKQKKKKSRHVYVAAIEHMVFFFTGIAQFSVFSCSCSYPTPQHYVCIYIPEILTWR